MINDASLDGGRSCPHTTWIHIGLNSRKCAACHEVRFTNSVKAIGARAASRSPYRDAHARSYTHTSFAHRF